MAIAPVFVLAGTGVSSTTTVTPTWPSHVTGDIGLLLVESSNQPSQSVASALVTAGGFAIVASAVGTGTASAASSVAIEAYWCRATSATMSPVTCVDRGDHTYARIFTFRGCPTAGSAIDVVFANVKATTATALTITGSATTTTDRDLVVVCVAGGNDAAGAQATAWANAGLASITERGDAGTTSGTGGCLAVATGEQVTAGAISNTTLTQATNLTWKNAYFVVTLKPDPNTLGDAAPKVPVPVVAATGKVGGFDTVRRKILDGIDSAQSEAHGWDVERANLPVTAVVRTANDVVTITLTTLAAYSITAQETLTVTIPGIALAGRTAIVATPTFTIADSAGGTTGNAALAFPKPVLAATGNVANKYAGNVVVAFPVPVLSARGVRGITGTGAPKVPVPVVAATGKQTHKANAAVAVTIPRITATGKQTAKGNAAVAFPRPVLAATGRFGSKGNAALVFPVPVVRATGKLTAKGNAVIAVPVPVLAAVGTTVSTGTTGNAALAFPVPVLAAVGKQTHKANAAIAFPVPALAARGVRGITGTAAPKVPVPVVAATGRLTSKANAAPKVPVPVVAATGKQTHKANAALRVPVPVVAATGKFGSKGNAALAFPVPVVAAVGRQTHKGNAALTVPQPVLAATGRQTHKGNAALVVPQPVVEATGTLTGQVVSGTAVLAVPVPTLAAEGIVVSKVTGNAAVAFPQPVLAATGSHAQAAAVAVAFPVPRVAARGKQTSKGSAAVAVPVPVIGAMGATFTLGLVYHVVTRPRVDLVWTPNHVSDETGFSVERRNVTDGGVYAEIGTTGAGVYAFSDDGPFDDSHQYQYRIVVEGGAHDGELSAEMTVFTNSNLRLRFRAPLAVPWVRVHVQSTQAGKGGLTYDPDNYVSQELVDCRAERLQDKVIAVVPGYRYAAFLVPIQYDGAGAEVVYDGEGGRFDAMASVASR